MAGVIAGAAPAQAHDELIASSPSPGQDVAAGPTEVSLTFSADVLTIGAAVIVADGSGRDWAVDQPTVASGVVTVLLEDALPTGGYEIRWWVVSSDGHPISGIVPFTVGGAAPLDRASAAETGDAATPDPADAQTQSASEDQGIIRILLVGVGGAIVAVAAYALIHLLRRKKDSTS